MYILTCASRVCENILLAFSHFLVFYILLIPFRKQRMYLMDGSFMLLKRQQGRSKCFDILTHAYVCGVCVQISAKIIHMYVYIWSC